MRLHLNGTVVDVPPALEADRLLFVLRDHVGLNGPRYGCGAGVCGACAVHVDGAAAFSCLLTPADVEGRAVVTLEGLGAGRADGLHPVQTAFAELRAPQCGYCYNGQAMVGAALLAERPDASAAEIEAGMDAVLCRCGTHGRVRAAMLRAQALLREGA